MKLVKCKLCQGSGQISSTEDEPWSEMVKRLDDKPWIEGYQSGYDKGYSDKRAVVIGEAYDKAESFKPGMFKLFKAMKLDDETAKIIVAQVIIEIGLHLK